jgi:hypothetical protein
VGWKWTHFVGGVGGRLWERASVDIARSQHGPAGLARTIHERFWFNREFAALTREATVTVMLNV